MEYISYVDVYTQTVRVCQNCLHIYYGLFPQESLNIKHNEYFVQVNIDNGYH